MPLRIRLFDVAISSQTGRDRIFGNRLKPLKVFGKMRNCIKLSDCFFEKSLWDSDRRASAMHRQCTGSAPLRRSSTEHCRCQGGLSVSLSFLSSLLMFSYVFFCFLVSLTFLGFPWPLREPAAISKEERVREGVRWPGRLMGVHWVSPTFQLL